MRTKFLFANLAINGFYLSPHAPLVSYCFIGRRPRILQVSRARFFAVAAFLRLRAWRFLRLLGYRRDILP